MSTSIDEPSLLLCLTLICSLLIYHIINDFYHNCFIGKREKEKKKTFAPVIDSHPIGGTSRVHVGFARAVILNVISNMSPSHENIRLSGVLRGLFAGFWFFINDTDSPVAILKYYIDKSTENSGGNFMPSAIITYPFMYLTPSEFVYLSHISPNEPDVGSNTRTKPNFLITFWDALCSVERKRVKFYKSIEMVDKSTRYQLPRDINKSRSSVKTKLMATACMISKMR